MDGAISLEEYLEGLKHIPDREAPEDASWIVKAWYKANTKKYLAVILEEMFLLEEY